MKVKVGMVFCTHSTAGQVKYKCKRMKECTKKKERPRRDIEGVEAKAEQPSLVVAKMFGRQNTMQEIFITCF